MRRATFIMLIPVLSVVLAGLCLAAGGHTLSNPLAATTPPSSYGGSRLYRSPNPLDSGGERVMTGNVRSGRYFRPGVPYYGRTDFQGSLGSTELDSFIRDSAGSESWRPGGSPSYFYSGTRTVPTTEAGRRGVFNPSMVTGKAADAYGLDALEGAQAGATVARPSVTSTESEMDMLTAQELAKLTSPTEMQGRMSLNDKTFKAWRENAREQLKSSQTDEQGGTVKALEAVDIDELAAEVMSGRIKTPSDINVERLRESVIERRIESQVESDSQEAMAGKGVDTGAGMGLKELTVEDILAQIKRDLGAADDRLETDTGSVEGDKSETIVAEATSPREMSKGERTYFTLYGSDRMQKISELTGGDMEDLKAEEQTYNFTRRKSAVEEVNSMPREDLAAEAKEIMGPYTDLAAYNEARFREKYHEAATYLRQGRYNQAADAFEASLVYSPGHPAAYIGRALALFANGEYASSALFLSRALSARPAYASTDVDLAAALGGREKLESRIADLEQWLGQSSDGEFEFLLAYIYYKIGSIDKARIAVKTAARRMANQAAVTPLREAIERAVAQSQQ